MDLVQQAVQEGWALHTVERQVFDRVLQIGYAATEMFLQGQGDGDLGETCTTKTGKTLFRSDEPVERPLQTVFGHHTIQAYVYAPGAHEKIDLRPVDARLQLSDRQTSYLLEEFSQYFCVDQAFAQAAQGIELVLNQKISVHVLDGTGREIRASFGREGGASVNGFDREFSYFVSFAPRILKQSLSLSFSLAGF